MDEDRRDHEPVDEVTSALARIRSRRNLLKAGVGAALGGIGMARSAPATAAGRIGIDDIDVPKCAGPSTFCVTVEVENARNGATISFGLFTRRRGEDRFRDSGQRVELNLVSGQEDYQVCFDVTAYQERLPNGRTEFNALRVHALGGAGGTFNRSVMRAKSEGVPPCGETATTAPPTTEPPTTAAPTTTSAATTAPATTTAGTTPAATTTAAGTTPAATTTAAGTTPPATTTAATTTGA